MASADIESDPMFCFQCEQTMRPGGCRKVGVCSKKPEIAHQQDVIVAGLKALSLYNNRCLELGLTPPVGIPEYTAYALFMTLTNTNFEPTQHDEAIKHISELIDQCKELIGKKTGIDASKVKLDKEAAEWSENIPPQKTRIDARTKKLGATVVGLQEMIIYGLKGLSAYLYHALRLGHTPPTVLKELPKVLAFVAEEPTDVEALLAECLKVGKLAHETTAALDDGNTTVFGKPEPTEVIWGARPGKCILVSGHDLLDLRELLEQTEGKGINVFTHGEMLPCNAYPGLKKFKHFVGHYGSAWQNQKKEFAVFPGPILMTTNCITPPTAEYKDRIWATGPVGFPEVKKVIASDPLPLGHEPSPSGSTAPPPTFKFPTTDYSEMIEQALSMPGFPDTVPTTPIEPPTGEQVAAQPSIPDPKILRKITVGFSHYAVEPLIGHVVDSALEGKLKRVFVIGGCDGYETNRSYFTDLARLVPNDCAILTLACGKFRINHLGLDAQKVPGTGIPRLMDVGQCNDAYSAVAIAGMLAKALNCTVDKLPLSVCLSWFEQKAVADLLTLLYVGVKNIKLGPRPPAFVTADALNVLSARFGLSLTTTPEKDIIELLA